MTQTTIVLKFGSSVLRSRADMLRVVHEVYRWYRRGHHVVAVVSAIGKATEELVAQSREWSLTPEPWSTAELLASGERVSAALLGLALDRAGIAARVVNPREIELQVRGAPLDGEPVTVSVVRIRELLSRHPVLVVPGFFGTDAAGRTQLLGRGGSDLTAVWLATSLGARCRLLKDVDGIYESDPVTSTAQPRRFTHIGYDDALRIAGRLVQVKAVAHLKAHEASCEVAALERAFHSLIHSGATLREGEGLSPTSAQAPIDVLLLGCGTVGLGVYQRLLAHSRYLRVCGVLVQDRGKHEASGVSPSLLHTKVDTLKDLRPRLVIDALPGLDPSHELIRRFLTQGADVVSANKAVMRRFAATFAALARETSATLRYSGAVGGSTPMLEAAALAANHSTITRLEAVLNGTCNFVLDACARGDTLANAVANAQRLGFAELDPSEDLSGRDAARKLGLLAHAAFGAEAVAMDVRELDESIAQAAQSATIRGYKLRQIARATYEARRVSCCLRFEEVAVDSVFGSLEGEWNALQVVLGDGDTITVRGRGAGRWPTTEAIMADVFDVVRAAGTPTTFSIAGVD